jgi:hypothetical protein
LASLLSCGAAHVASPDGRSSGTVVIDRWMEWWSIFRETQYVNGLISGKELHPKMYRVSCTFSLTSFLAIYLEMN